MQRQVDRGGLRLPDTRPAVVSERAWLVLVRHVRDRVPYTALAAALGITEHTVRQLADQATAALRYPELADLPAATRGLRVRAGYTVKRRP